MRSSTGHTLLDNITTFCKQQKIAESTFGRRAVNDGEMTPEQAFEEQNKVKFQHMTSNLNEEAYAALPVRLRELNEASLNLHRRVMAIDRLLKSELDNSAVDAPKAIDDQMSRLTQAFGPMVEVPKSDTPQDETS